MSVGKEYLRQIHDVLAVFEEAIKNREHPGFTGSKVSLQQDVDKARQRVVDVVVELVTKDRLRQ